MTPTAILKAALRGDPMPLAIVTLASLVGSMWATFEAFRFLSGILVTP